jgi:hypothetical protein
VFFKLLAALLASALMPVFPAEHQGSHIASEQTSHAAAVADDLPDFDGMEWDTQPLDQYEPPDCETGEPMQNYWNTSQAIYCSGWLELRKFSHFER